uniref:Putative catechol-O-methyltransferase domain containing 1 n=1 Tax=Schistosoma japonicum TaxID=6182 RepID=C1L4K7_SCHJA|nr:putative catechol-O-methyltransferase domain containing 1 [Schistosoma japonicum]
MNKLNKRKLNYLPSSDEVYQYITDHSLRLSKAQNWLIQETSKHPLSAMLISDMEMQLLSNLCYMINAKMTLDIGVYTGYSALSIAEVLPSDGRVLALDITDAYLQDYCIPAWKMANVDSKIDFRLGPAAQTLQNLIDNGYSGTFDFALIDADKEEYSHLYELCLQLIRPRGIIAIDNVLWSLHVLDDNNKQPSTVSIRKLNDFLAKDERVRISFLNVSDGLTIVVKK